MLSPHSPPFLFRIMGGAGLLPYKNIPCKSYLYYFWCIRWNCLANSYLNKLKLRGWVIFFSKCLLGYPLGTQLNLTLREQTKKKPCLPILYYEIIWKLIQLIKNIKCFVKDFAWDKGVFEQDWPSLDSTFNLPIKVNNSYLSHRR